MPRVMTWSPPSTAPATPVTGDSPYLTTGCGILGLTQPAFVYWDDFSYGPGITDGSENEPFGVPHVGGFTGFARLNTPHNAWLCGGTTDYNDTVLLIGKPFTGGVGRLATAFGVTAWYFAVRMRIDANSLPLTGSDTYVRLTAAVQTANTQATIGVVNGWSITNFGLGLSSASAVFSNAINSSWHVFEMWHLPSVSHWRVYGRVDGGASSYVEVSPGFNYGTGINLVLRACSTTKVSNAYFDWVLFVTDGN